MYPIVFKGPPNWARWYLSISIVTLSTIQNKQVPSIQILVQIVYNGRKIDARALLDSGAEDIYCNATFVKNHGFPLLPLQSPIYP